MLHYDVLIIGGGPSGSSLAFLLLKQGISCCIIDREKFPRDKLCGGLLTEKTVSLIESIYGDIHFPCERISSSVSLFFGEKKLSNVTTQSKFYLVERRKFDNYFIDRFRELGGIVYEKENVQSVDQSQHIVELQGNKKIGYKVLVGADGANSFVRKMVAPDYKPNAICVESSYKSDVVDDEICVFFTEKRSGYGWCFPKNNYYTVGMGGDTKWNKKIKESFIAFSEKIGKPVEKHTIQGAMIPFGKFVKCPYKKDILLIGDAAGLVDPITGEGLFFAFWSAMFASTAIEKQIKDGTAFDRTYAKEIKAIHSIINEANRFNKSFFSYGVKNRILPLLEGRENIVRYYCDNLLANYDVPYMQFPFRYYNVRRKRKRGKR